MFIYKFLVLSVISIVLTFVTAQYGGSLLLINQIYSQDPRFVRPNLGVLYFTQEKLQRLPALQILTNGFLQGSLRQFQPQDKVKIQLFYECLCRYSRRFATMQLTPTVEKLSRYLDVHLYPYGNARTIIHANGSIDFQCQHGPNECYGNKLHACAIELIGNITEAVEFNSCMMNSGQSNKGSDDTAADKCGLLMNIASSPIKLCAKSPRAVSLLKYYGDESKKVGFQYVPYILINGVESNGGNFMRDVCAAFKKPPPECSN